MYNTILVPIDLSYTERVGPLLDIARHLAAKNARIILVNFVEDIPSYIAAELPMGILEDTDGRAAEDLREIARSADLQAEIEVRRGHAGSGILSLAEEKDADMIIIASHRPGWEDFFIGSTAARVVRYAKCSVHVMR